MLVSVIRVTILYLITSCAVRLMGKRQIGEMQPTELVATILISNIAAIPIQDNDLPLMNSISAVLVLVCFEVINTVAAMGSLKYRRLVQGSPVVVVRDGVIDQKQMRKLRLTVSDLMSALRQKDIFDLKEVAYAVVETDGKISILQRAENQPVTPEDTGMQVKKESFCVPVIIDGKQNGEGIAACGITQEKLQKIITSAGADVKSIFVMTLDGEGKYNIVKKE